MSLRDALTAEVAALSKGPTCGIAKLLDRLDDDDRDALRAYMADTEVPHVAIERAIKTATDTRIAAQTVQRHRQGKCNCPKPDPA